MIFGSVNDFHPYLYIIRKKKPFELVLQLLISLVAGIVMPKHRSAVDVVNQLQKCDGWAESTLSREAAKRMWIVNQLRTFLSSVWHLSPQCILLPSTTFRLVYPSPSSPSLPFSADLVLPCVSARKDESPLSMIGDGHYLNTIYEASLTSQMRLPSGARRHYVGKRAGEESSAVVSSDELQGSVFLSLLLIYWQFKPFNL